MAAREDLMDWVVEALEALNGSGTLLDVAKKIWEIHEKNLSGTNLFYTWQYDYRWAATKLREKGTIKPAEESPKGTWELNYG